jgi:hypothetical protein
MLTRKVRPATGQRAPKTVSDPDSLQDPGSHASARAKLFSRFARRMDLAHRGGDPDPVAQAIRKWIAVDQPRPEDHAAEGEADSPADQLDAGRAEIESWIRDELGRAEETLREDAGAIRERVISELRELVEKTVGERVAEAEATAESRHEQRAVELQAWADQVRVETEERISGAHQSLSFRARRHELKLARQERNRKLKSAERRLGAHGELLTAELRRQAIEAEERIRTTEQQAERRLDDAARSIAEGLRRDLLQAAAGANNGDGDRRDQVTTPGSGRRFVTPS